MRQLRYLIIATLIQILFYSNAFSNVNIDSLLAETNTATSDSHRIELLKQITEHYITTDPNQALFYAEELTKASKRTNDNSSLAEGLFLTTRIYSDLGFTEKAFSSAQESYEITKALNNRNLTIRLLNNIGNIYWFDKNFETALFFYKKVFEYTSSDSSEQFIPQIYMNVGLAYSGLEQYDSALTFFHYSLNALDNKTREYGTGIISSNMSSLFLRLRQFDSALYYGLVSAEYTYLYQPSLTAEVFLTLGEIYSQTGYYNLATNYLDSAKAIATEINSIRVLQEYHLAHYKLDTLQKHYKDALTHYTSYSKLRDSISSEKYNNKLAYFEKYFDADQKETEIKSLYKKDKTSSYIIKAQRITLFLFILVAIVTSVLSFILFRFFKQQRTLGAELKERHKRLTRKNTTLLKREKELHESNETKSKLFSIIAHDIKNPLYAMLRLGDMLEDKYDKHSDEKRKEYLHYLNQAGKELVNLTENLLSWSRYQLGNIKYNPNYFSVLEAVEFAVGFFRHMASLKEVELKIKIPTSHMVYGDMSMIILVIRNLANNAVKFTKRNGSIEITSVDELDHIKISVIDNGVGISRELLQKLFLIEKGVSKFGTEGEKGSGLGLALCKEFVLKNKGKIGVKSKVGVGSEFWFTLPKNKK